MSQIKQFLAEKLFASPVSGFEVPNAEELNKALIADCLKRREVEPGLSVSNQAGWHSNRDLFTRQEDSFRQLNHAISVVLMHVVKGTLPKFDPVSHDIEGQGWVNINGKGGFNTPHDHTGFHWSGCYYVNVPDNQAERSGFIEFLDPRGSTGIRAPEVSMLFAPKFQVRPRAGTMLIFPSYLTHWVYPNQDDEDRISIAFNARVTERGTTVPITPAGETK